MHLLTNENNYKDKNTNSGNDKINNNTSIDDNDDNDDKYTIFV